MLTDGVTVAIAVGAELNTSNGVVVAERGYSGPSRSSHSHGAVSTCPMITPPHHGTSTCTVTIVSFRAAWPSSYGTNWTVPLTLQSPPIKAHPLAVYRSSTLAPPDTAGIELTRSSHPRPVTTVVAVPHVSGVAAPTAAAMTTPNIAIDHPDNDPLIAVYSTCGCIADTPTCPIHKRCGRIVTSETCLLCNKSGPVCNEHEMSIAAAAKAYFMRYSYIPHRRPSALTDR